MYLISGFFFQDVRRARLRHDSEQDGGTRVIEEDIKGSRFFFSGSIYCASGKLEDGQVATGSLTDDFGTSVLSRVEISETAISFVKRYECRMDEIRYEFSVFQNGLHFGTWSGKDAGCGVALCELTEVSDEYLDAQTVKSIIERH